MFNTNARPAQRSALLIALQKLCLAGALIATGAHAGETPPPQNTGPMVDVSPVRQLPVQDGGRTKPFDTFCREAMLTITDEESVDRQDPVETVLSLAFEPDSWRERRIIALSYRPHRKTLGVPEKQSTISYDELVKNPAFAHMMDELDKARGKDLNDAQKEDSRLFGRVATVDAIFKYKAIHLVPIPGNEEAAWLSPADVAEASDKNHAVAEQWEAMGKEFKTRNSSGFAAAVAKLRATLSAIDPKGYPTASTIDLEVNYNLVRPFRTAAWAYIATFCLLLAQVLGNAPILLFLGIPLLTAGFLLTTGIGLPWSMAHALPGWLKFSVAPMFIISGICMTGGYFAKKARWMIYAAVVLALGGWILHSGGLVTRVVLSGRGPISNMFESMIYLGWGSVSFALIFAIFQGFTYFGLASTAVAAIMLISAENSFDPFIAPLVPVLRSYWLWIHVQIIILGYAGLALCIMMGHLRLLFSYGPDRGKLHAPKIDPILHRSMQIGAACLGTGIILGGIWADYSWGRYWGWDPKETWALITFLFYAAIMHGRFAGWLNGPGVAMGAVLGVFPLLMTYYGVNFLLVGLHSYAGADANAGATFVDKLLTVPPWLSLLLLFETVFLQVADAVIMRSGKFIAGSLVIEALFLWRVWGKVPAYFGMIVLGQLVLCLIAYHKATPAVPTKGNTEGGTCARCENTVVALDVAQPIPEQPQVSPEEILTAACWCTPCKKVLCAKCCGISRGSPTLAVARCPDCEQKVEWASKTKVRKQA